jgi:hypothetical protein
LPRRKKSNNKEGPVSLADADAELLKNKGEQQRRHARESKKE